MRNELKQFFQSWAFVVSSLVLIIYFVLFDGKTVFTSKGLEFVFYFYISLLPLIISVFAILISFTDKTFLKFLRNVKTGKTNVYDTIIFYFVNNTFIVFLSLIIVSIALWFDLSSYAYLQYLMIFLFPYTIVSFIQLVRFIFYFARKKAEFVDLDSDTKKEQRV